MLPSNILKLRLDRIENKGHHLSVKDQLKLVTLVHPDLQANFYSQFLSVHLPKNWHFACGTAEDIQCSLRLIRLIEQTFIPQFSTHALRYQWFEQGLAFRLQYAEAHIDHVKLKESILPKLAQCVDSELKLSILKQLHREYSDIEITYQLAQSYVRFQDWDRAIELYQSLENQQKLSETGQYDLIQSLLQRNRAAQGADTADAFRAIELITQRDHFHSEKDRELLNTAVALLLPDELKSTTQTAQNRYQYIQHKLKYVGYSLNHWLISNDLIIPYFKRVVGGAPKLLSNQEIITQLDRHKLANQVLQQILSRHDLKLIRGLSSAHYHLSFIWNYLQINPLILDALVSAAQTNEHSLYNLKQIAAPDENAESAFNNVSAFLAKQQVAYNLSQKGHTIEFVEHSQYANFDLIVDGTPMQVRCTLDLTAVEAFVQTHPDIAVIVNIELAELQKYDSVFVDLALSYETVQRTAQISLQQGRQSDDFLAIPLMNTGFAVYRNFEQSRHRMPKPVIDFKTKNKLGETLGLGAALGGAFSGSLGAIVVGGVSLYRTWRLQRKEHARTEQQKQQLMAQCHQVMQLLIDFAEWFEQDLLKYRVELYAYQLQLIENKLIGKIPQSVISTHLYAYKYAAYQRASMLHAWMKAQLNHSQMKYRAQAGWVALSYHQEFMSIEFKRRVEILNQELEKYQQLSQVSSFKQIRQPIGAALI